MAGLGGAVKLTGESEYRRALSQITQSLREMSSAMKVVDTEYAADDKSMAATTAKAAALNNVYAQQDNKLKTLQKQYDASRRSTTRTSRTMRNSLQNTTKRNPY